MGKDILPLVPIKNGMDLNINLEKENKKPFKLAKPNPNKTKLLL